MNKDIKTRDTLIFGSYNPKKYCGGARGFDGVSADLLKKLLEMDFIEEDECQNSSPSTIEFLNFMECHPTFTAHGYVISDDRDDYRMTIEGIESPDMGNEEMLKDFVKFARYADDFCIDNDYYCWWD